MSGAGKETGAAGEREHLPGGLSGMLKALFLAGFFIVSMSVIGKSQQPSSQPSQQRSTQEERGSEKLPFVVKVYPSEKFQNELQDETAKHEYVV